MNRFERPQINNQSKQALSIMLRQRHPPFMPGNQPAGQPGQQFNMQQQRNQLQLQQQQQQHQQYIRTSLRGMNPSQMGNNQMTGMVQPGMGPGINPNNMIANQPSQMPQSQIAQNQQPGIGGIMGQTGGNMMSQTGGRLTPASMSQAGGMIGQAGGNMMPQGNRTMAPTTMMSQQAAAGMVPQGMNSSGVPVPGIQQGVQGGQQSMFSGNSQQFSGMAQNFGGGGGYANQGMPQQPNLQQNMQMGNFNQINAQRSQAEFLAQQQRNLQQQQQQQQQVQANRQFTQQVPNVTMNTMNNMVAQAAVGNPPQYPRQQGSGAAAQTQQQQQLFQQQVSIPKVLKFMVKSIGEIEHCYSVSLCQNFMYLYP